jgi:glycine hydroxymethyltransferase
MLIILLKIILQIYYNLTVSQGFVFCCKLTKNNEMQRDKQIFDLILEEQERQIRIRISFREFRK